MHCLNIDFYFRIAKELQELKTTIRDKDFNEFIDSQISAGILTPANKDAVLSILQDLDNVKKEKFVDLIAQKILFMFVLSFCVLIAFFLLPTNQCIGVIVVA